MSNEYFKTYYNLLFIIITEYIILIIFNIEKMCTKYIHTINNKYSRVLTLQDNYIIICTLLLNPGLNNSLVLFTTTKIIF